MTDETIEVVAPISDQLDSMATSSATTQDMEAPGPDPLPLQNIQSPIFRIKYEDREYAANFKNIVTIDRQESVIFINERPRSFQDEATAIKIYESLLELWARFA